MKIVKKVFLLVLVVSTMLIFSGCEKKEDSKEEEKLAYEKNPIVTMQVEYMTNDGETKQGTIKMELYPNKAPETVANFVNLIQNGFYNGIKFHRIVKDFMIQAGDPEEEDVTSAYVSDIDKSVEKGSESDYEYSIKGEFKENGVDNDVKFEAGTLGLARSDFGIFGMAQEGYNSGCSQFFITCTDNSSTCESLQDTYAAFGKVIEGYDVVLELSNVEVSEAESELEISTPVNQPVIKSMEVDTMGEQYEIPNLINAEETMKKVQTTYMQYMQQMMQAQDGGNSQNEVQSNGNNPQE